MGKNISEMTAAEKREVAGKNLLSLSQRGNDIQRKYVDGIPSSYRLRFWRALFGEASMRSVIAAKCRDCVGYEDVRQNMEFNYCCTCPLMYHRPYRNEEMK